LTVLTADGERATLQKPLNREIDGIRVIGIRCPRCGAENPDSNRFCGNCGRTLTENAGIRENLTDGRYGPADPEYPEETEKPYVVWKWPYTIWSVSIQTYSRYVIQSILIWIFFFTIMLIPILRFGPTALVVVIIIAAFFGVLQYIFWKAGRSAAEELNWARKKGIEPPINRF
jgi:hypothetical protein